MNARAALLAAAVVGGCGDQAPARHGPSPQPSPTAEGASPAPTVGGAPPTAVAQIPDPQSRGAKIVIQSGCLACHLMAGEGNRGPGPELTTVGAELNRSELRRVLRDPNPPMPSYATLPRERLEALVDYLAARR